MIEANAIVRYFAVIGSKPWSKKGEETLKDFSLIEFEESGQGIKASGVAEGLISESGLSTVSAMPWFPLVRGSGLNFLLPVKDASLPPSPAEIILLSALYDLASAPVLDGKSQLSAWLIKVTGTGWAKHGTKEAAMLTTESPAGGAAPAGRDKVERVVVKNIKEGLEMKTPKPGEDM